VTTNSPLQKPILRKDANAKKKQGHGRLKLGSSRVVHTSAPNVTKLATNKSNFKMACSTRVRGSMVCNNYIRPRYIYCQYAVSLLKPPHPYDGPESSLVDEVQKQWAMAKAMLLDATESTIFTCGMAPLDPDDPCYAIFHCDPSLDYDTHIESEFYTSKIHPQRIDIYCHCDGTKDSLAALNSYLKTH
jgi:hypothetical protein